MHGVKHYVVVIMFLGIIHIIIVLMNDRHKLLILFRCDSMHLFNIMEAKLGLEENLFLFLLRIEELVSISFMLSGIRPETQF